MKKNKKTTHVFRQPGHEQVEVTFYEYPTRVVAVIFAEHLRESITPEEDLWLKSLVDKVPLRGRELLVIGSDGGYFFQPEQGPLMLRVVRAAIKRRFGLSDKEAAKHGLTVDDKFAIVPKRNPSGGWKKVRYRYKIKLEFEVE